MLLDFIFKDKKILSSDKLKLLKIIVKGENTDNLNLTKEQEQLLIELFIMSDIPFNENTPDFIINNSECIKCALNRDINSINFIKEVDSILESYITQKALDHNFILKEESPIYLKNNFDIALNSIRLDYKSVDYIDWDYFSEDYKNILVDEIIKSQYVLSSSSHSFLANNVKVIHASIERDKTSSQYVGKDAAADPEMFKLLILNGYPYSNEQILDMKLSTFSDIEVLCACLSKLKVYGNNDEKYIANFNKIYFDVITSKPMIKAFNSIFQVVASSSWISHRRLHFNEYDNIFGKICSELRYADDFSTAIDEVGFLPRMQTVLDAKYTTLHKAMKEYFEIYHSEEENKLQKLEQSKNTIAELSAKYVAKCKESYKKNIIEDCYKNMRKYFALKLDNPYVNKKLIYASKKEQFNKLYQSKDDEIYYDFIDKLYKRYCAKYEKEINPYIIYHMMLSCVTSNYERINQMIRVPQKYEMYKKYEKAVKLIRRLNNGYIEYDGVEVLNYRNIISFNKDKKEYFYSGITFDDKDLYAFDKYRRTMKVFDMIKKDINLKIKSMDFSGNIDVQSMEKLSSELPFTDEYFEFSTDYVLEQFKLNDLKDTAMDGNFGFQLSSLTSDKLFFNVYNVLVNNGLIWMLLFAKKNSFLGLYSSGINKDTIIEIVDDMEDISNLADNLKFNINNCSELLLVHKLYKCADMAAIAILGKDITEKLCKCTSYTDEDEEKIIQMAKGFVCDMVKRNKSTVPYVEGSTMNYRYSMYDSQDNSILISGINTDACFKIDGAANDFLHYCALDKNGFVIKITDLFGNFIARAAGFRNGNCVFVNQLRTIYDQGGNYYCGKYDNEREEIIETFEKACLDIVNTSQRNSNEKEKIDFVFVTQSYSMEFRDPNIPFIVEEKIGSNPMDNDSDDWNCFLSSCKNIQEADDDGDFYTDYGDYPLICVASIKEPKSIVPKDIMKKDVPAVYERKRNKVVATNEFDEQLYQRLNKIAAIEANFNEKDFIPVDLPEKGTVFIGDNWFIIYDENKIIDYCLLEFDDNAKVEFDLTEKFLANNTFDNDNKLPDLLQIQNGIGYTRVLKK